MKKTLTILTVLILFGINAIAQEIKLSELIENSEACEIEAAILNKKIVVLNPEKYSNTKMQKFTIDSIFYDTGEYAWSVFNEQGESGYAEFLENGVYTITGLAQKTNDRWRGKQKTQVFDCSYNDYGKLVQLNDSIYTYLNPMKWTEL